MFSLSSLLLNVFVLASLLTAVYENKISIKEKEIKNTKIKLGFVKAIFVGILTLVLTISFLIFSPRGIVEAYVFLAFSVLNIANAFWLTIDKSRKRKIVALFFAAILIVVRFNSENAIIHNLFVISAISWLGPLFTKTKIIKLKHFIIISILMFSYDIIYVWLSPLSGLILQSTREIGFPLGIYVGQSLIGSGDLLYANFAISFLKSNKLKILMIAAYLISNIALDVAASYVTITSFPLLVLWVPISLFIFYFGKIASHET